MKKWKIYVVAHTHWDKEWYFSKSESDVLLLTNLAQVIKVLKERSDFHSFTYDAQTSIIDDYLHFKPDAKSTIVELLKNKKLIIGPWYTQPDLFNSTSESIIRNLLLGITIAKQYSADYLKVAYVPDSFGHNSQMPQIYQGFNLNHFIYWRGIRKTQLDNKVLHQWKGIDGSTIIAYNFYSGYWAMGTHFPYTTLTKNNVEQKAANFLSDFASLLDTLKANAISCNNKLLIPLGGDQGPIVELLPEFIASLNQIDKTHQWILTDYEQYFNQVDDLTDKLHLVEGELKSPQFARIHKTIASQRYDIKQLCKQVEYNLYNRLEPLVVYFNSLKGAYPFELILKALKLITISQAHDSLGGCNSDKTNDDIINRLNQANQLIEAEIIKIIKSICLNLSLSMYDLIIFNPLTYDIKQQWIKLKLNLKFKNFNLFIDNQKVEYYIENIITHNVEAVFKTVNDGENELASDSFYEIDLYIKVNQLNAMNYKIVMVKASETNILGFKENRNKSNSCENEYWKISINKEGTLDIIDKRTNVKYMNQFFLKADHDNGDSYDYSPLFDEQNHINQLVKSEYKINKLDDLIIIELNNSYKLPKTIVSSIMVQQDFTFNFKISNSDVIDFTIDTDNKAYEVRWRLWFDTNLTQNYHFANQAYCTVKRLNDLSEDLANWESEKWNEKPVAIETNESFVCLKNETNNEYLGFLTKGCNEYQIIDNCKIALTLFRSVSFLGKADLLWRKDRASGVSEISCLTEKARLLKPLSFKIGWFISKTNPWILAEKFVTDLISYQIQKHNPLYLPFDRFMLLNYTPNLLSCKFDSLIKVSDDNFIVKTVKLSEDKKTIIVRGFNSISVPIKVQLFYQDKLVKFNKLNLLEQIITPDLEIDTLETMKIATYSIAITY